MKILLVVPPVSFDLRREIKHAKLMIHLGMAYIASSLRRKGFEVAVCDIPAERLTLTGVGERVRTFSPRLVGITGFTAHMHQAHTVAAAVKEIDSNIITVIGGAHASALPEKTLEEFNAFDIAVAGEGEETLVEIASRFEEGALSPAHVAGAAWRENGNIRFSGKRPFIRDLDSLAFPAFDLFPLQTYRASDSLFAQDGIFPIMSSRGCPFRCSFCFRLLGEQVRFRSLESVMQEMKRDRDVFGARQFFFQDETFTVDRERTVQFCEAVLRSGLRRDTDWICETRVDAVDRELLLRMKDAGCTLINYGVESGSQDILDKSRKKITLEQIRQALAYTKELKIRTFTNFIIGNPYDTPRTIKQTIQLALELDSDFASFTILTPFPGTETREMARNRVGGLRLMSEDWRDYSNQFGNALELEAVPRTMLERFQRQAYFRFYVRPGHFGRIHQLVNVKAAFVYSVLYYLRRFMQKATVCLRSFCVCLRAGGMITGR